MKFKKLHKNSIKINFLLKTKNFNLSKYFLVSLNFVKISFKQLEIVRRTIIRKTLKFSFTLSSINPFFFYTKKSKNSRMGKGCGSVVSNSIVYHVKPGTVVFEFIGISNKKAIQVIIESSKKLPGKYKLKIN